jgi:hypothetical protein
MLDLKKTFPSAPEDSGSVIVAVPEEKVKDDPHQRFSGNEPDGEG